MTAYMMVKVICDKITGKVRCGRSEVVDEADSRSSARLALNAAGWKTMQIKGRLHDRCPDHDPVKEGIADDTHTARTTARMKGWLDQNSQRSRTTMSNPVGRKVA